MPVESAENEERPSPDFSALLIRDLSVSFGSDPVVRAVDLDVRPGQIVGLVGASGSGKSVTALAILSLLGPGAQVSGQAHFEGADLLELNEARLRRVRGSRIALVFQEPGSRLHPLLRMDTQLTEAMCHHLGLTAAGARERARTLLARLGFAEPDDTLRAFPHQLSGGMQQRALIAAALSCDPAVLIADEPTTALDATTRRQILELLCREGRGRKLGLLLISHDLAALGGAVDRVLVMHEGRIVESGSPRQLFSAAAHPATRELVAAARAIDTEPFGGSPPG